MDTALSAISAGPIYIMYRYLFFFCAVFFYTGALYAQLNISGMVKNIHAPVAGATVILNNRLAVSKTDNNGYFFFKNLPAGNYTLLVSSVGYRQDTIQIELKE